MCYSKCHNVDIISLEEITYIFMNAIILAINERDILKPLGI